MKTTEKICKKIVNQLTGEGRYGWPPSCTGFLYQPQRPEESSSAKSDSESSEKR